jgi:hypothetical protein
MKRSGLLITSNTSLSLYKREVTVKENDMTKRALIKAAHVRNDEFITELRQIIELVPSLCAWQATRIQAMSDEQSKGAEDVTKMLEVEVAFAKVMLDRLEALVEKWPNAVWVLFPETGATGWIRLLNEFHRKVLPYFPGTPQRVMWRSKRVRGHRWCGIAQRIREQSVRTFRIWDQFQAGRKPMEIVRREFPLRSADLSGISKKELMAVHRSLERASQLIYGQPLPKKRRARRLLGFNLVDHMATCGRCSSAKCVENFCPQALDFVNQDQTS